MKPTSIPSTGSSQISKILSEMNAAGNFPIAIVTDQHGFPLASAFNQGEDPETQSAVVALIQKTALQTEMQLGMGQTDEISLFDAQGRRLVCRPFDANGYRLILAVQISDRHQSYRRLTNKAIREIKRAWKL
jgi:predicted regulator of Ras-like GTPase activity (Roadblock/LC7/MglB family)